MVRFIGWVVAIKPKTQWKKYIYRHMAKQVSYPLNNALFFYVGLLGVSLVDPVSGECDWVGCKLRVPLLWHPVMQARYKNEYGKTLLPQRGAVHQNDPLCDIY